VTTLPLVLNFLRRKPSTPTSEKNCLLPVRPSAWWHQTSAVCIRVCSAKHTLLSPKQTDEEYPRAVDREQRSNGVEFGCEYLEHDQGERELPDCSAHVCAFKCSLGCTNLDQLRAGEHH
jgi:hypothetical protein